MKFRLVRYGEEIYLLLHSGDLRVVSKSEAREMVLKFDSMKDDVVEGDPLKEHFDGFEGTVLATLKKDNQLIIHDAEFFRDIMSLGEFPYYTADEFAEVHGRKVSIVRKHCVAGRIEGAHVIGKTWLIPKNAPYPKDNRAGRDMSKRYAYKHQQ